MTNYFQYNTPDEIAKCLVEEAPEKCQKILEPSVGNGALLDALKEKVDNLQHVVSIDISNSITELIAEKYQSTFSEKLDVINSDYLKWSLNDGRQKYSEYFDCILMNPPFIAKKAKWVKGVGEYDNIPQKVPLEIAFILQSLPLLKNNGTLLAVLPTSAISSKRFKWFRKVLLQVGKVVSVHELPKYSFPKIESKIYLFVFRKGQSNGKLILKNHSLKNPDVLPLVEKSLNSDLRLDYNFYHGKDLIDRLQERHQDLLWESLGKHAQLTRGNENSPEGKSYAIHTTEYDHGFWKKKKNKNYHLNEENVSIQKDDIIVKRVGRNCSSSIGTHINLVKHLCTDCILIIRPDIPNQMEKLLFSLRVVYCSDQGKKFLERGTGAKYLSIKDLRKCKIPLLLSEKFDEDYRSYKRALSDKDHQAMKEIEKKVFRSLNVTFNQN